MIRCGGCDWTTVAVDEVLPIFFAKSCRATQFFENSECSIDSLLASFAWQLARMLLSHLSACGAHSGTQILWLNLAGEYRHQERDQSAICLGKYVFGLRAECIRRVRF